MKQDQIDKDIEELNQLNKVHSMIMQQDNEELKIEFAKVYSQAIRNIKELSIMDRGY